MSATNKAKGSAHERAVLMYHRNLGLDAERLALAGARDESDVCWKNGGLIHLYECKNTQALNTTDFIRQAEAQAKNYQIARNLDVLPHWAVAWKARGESVGRTRIILTLDEYVRLAATPF